MVKILVVGQTPPPYGGQALMINYMLESSFDKIKLYHVRMAFSKEMNERGKVSLYKLTHIIKIISQIYFLKIKHSIPILYYPPGNHPKIAVFRDVVILFFTRYLFKKVVFHFHSAGISEEISKMSLLEKRIIRFTFSKPDLAISNSIYNPPDGKYLEAKSNIIIPLGIPDAAKNVKPDNKNWNENKEYKILFVGLLNTTKGEGYVLQAIDSLVKRGYNVKLLLAGKFETEEYKSNFFETVEKLNLSHHVKYLGIITGLKKHQTFLEADIFCFPSFFISESFGVVLLEAMQYSLPVIATRWRGIQSIVEDEVNGYLIDIKNSIQISEKIEFLIKNSEILKQLSKNSRKLYLSKYTLDKYVQNLQQAFLGL